MFCIFPNKISLSSFLSIQTRVGNKVLELLRTQSTEFFEQNEVMNLDLGNIIRVATFFCMKVFRWCMLSKIFDIGYNWI